MNCYKVFIDGYESESAALVLTDDGYEAAAERAKPNLDVDDEQLLRIVRMPHLDGDTLTDRLLWETETVAWCECTWCGTSLRRGSHNVQFDLAGNIYCNGVCILDARIPPQTEPTTLVMIGTEY